MPPRSPPSSSGQRYLGLPADVIATSLLGAAALGAGSADVSVFFGNAATFPWRSHAHWLLGQMQRWGYLGAGADLAAAAAIVRPELHAGAARSPGLPVPVAVSKSEGCHARPWLLPASPKSIRMGPDRFIDGARFIPEPSDDPAADDQICCNAQKTDDCRGIKQSP